MKTINDLVDRLNNYDMACEVNKVDDRYYLEDDLSAYIYFKDGDWDILSSFCMLHHEVQKEIMDFIYTTDSNHWFDEQEKKYNIVIGENEREKIKTAYQKLHDGTYIADSVEEDDLKRDRYIFTESEIEDLKATLPDNMAKIVDLGKVEVKYE